jgi:amino acid transporter
MVVARGRRKILRILGAARSGGRLVGIFVRIAAAGVFARLAAASPTSAPTLGPFAFPRRTFGSFRLRRSVRIELVAVLVVMHVENMIDARRAAFGRLGILPHMIFRISAG